MNPGSETMMIGQVNLSDMEREILLTALNGKSEGEDVIEFLPWEADTPEGCRRALADLVLRDLLAWTGTHTYRLTDEGAVTAAALLTRVSA